MGRLRVDPRPVPGPGPFFFYNTLLERPLVFRLSLFSGVLVRDFLFPAPYPFGPGNNEGPSSFPVLLAGPSMEVGGVGGTRDYSQYPLRSISVWGRVVFLRVPLSHVVRTVRSLLCHGGRVMGSRGWGPDIESLLSLPWSRTLNLSITKCHLYVSSL